MGNSTIRLRRKFNRAREKARKEEHQNLLQKRLPQSRNQLERDAQRKLPNKLGNLYPFLDYLL